MPEVEAEVTKAEYAKEMQNREIGNQTERGFIVLVSKYFNRLPINLFFMSKLGYMPWVEVEADKSHFVLLHVFLGNQALLAANWMVIIKIIFLDKTKS